MFSIFTYNFKYRNEHWKLENNSFVKEIPTLISSNFSNWQQKYVSRMDGSIHIHF